MPIIIPSKNIVNPIKHNATNNNKITFDDIGIIEKSRVLNEEYGDYTITISRVGDTNQFQIKNEYGYVATVSNSESEEKNATDIVYEVVSFDDADRNWSYLIKSWFGKYKSLSPSAIFYSESHTNLGKEAFDVWFGGKATIRYTETIYEGEVLISPQSTSNKGDATVRISAGGIISSDERIETFEDISAFNFRADAIPSYKISPYINESETVPRIERYFNYQVNIINSDTNVVDARYHTFDTDDIILTDILECSAIAIPNKSIGVDETYVAPNETNIIRRRRVNEITLHCGANKRTLELQEAPPPSESETKKYTISGDYVIDENKYMGRSLSDFAQEQISNAYGNGVETAEISARITEYYDADGYLRISTKADGVPMTFSIGDLIIPMRRNEYGVDVPLSRVFRVCGIKTTFNGEAIQTISAQSTNDDPRISGTPHISINHNNVLQVYRKNRGNIDIYIDGVKTMEIGALKDNIDLNEANLVQGRHSVFAVEQEQGHVPSANSKVLTFDVLPKLPTPRNIRVDKGCYLHASVANADEVYAHIYVDGKEIIKGEADMFLPYNIQESIKTPRRYKIGVRVSPRVEGVYRASDIAYIDYISYGFLSFDFDSTSDGLVCLGRGTFEGKNVIIPETSALITTGITDIPVRTIGAFAFYSSNIESVVVPSSVRRILPTAFDSCENLEYVSMREGVELISSSAFENCTKLEEVVIPNTTITLGSGAFRSCIGLKNAKIGNQINRIETAVFANCQSLVSISIPKSVKTIGQYAFANCNALSHIYYEGSESEWKKIYKDSGNTALSSATIHYGVY